MKIAIPTWNGRISPVFDTASRLLVVEIKEKSEVARFETDISEHFLPGKTMRLTGLEIDTLICGAISRPLAYMITTAGIKLIPWIAGQVEEILEAFLKDNLFDPQYIMPGCAGYRGNGYGRQHGRGGWRRQRRTNFS
ncbi:MAG: NifB/NifX family molybdenum-iron cluster-binding protein [Thermodesulfobacteriota bacterium]